MIKAKKKKKKSSSVSSSTGVKTKKKKKKGTTDDDIVIECKHMKKLARPIAVRQSVQRLSKTNQLKPKTKSKTPQYCCVSCGQITRGESKDTNTATDHFSSSMHCIGIGVQENNYECYCFKCREEIPIDTTASKRLHECINLVGELFTEEKTMLNDENNNTKQMVTMSRRKRRSSSSAATRQKQYDPNFRCIGLHNLGNTCFFNSVLQNLLRIEELSSYFRSKWNGNPSHTPVQYAFNTFLDHVSTYDRPVCNPAKLLEAICHVAPMFRGARQHDAQELLRTLLDAMREEQVRVARQERMRSIYETIESWSTDDIHAWINSLGLQQDIIKSLNDSGRAINGPEFRNLVQNWKSKDARRVRRRMFRYNITSDKLKFTAGVQQLRQGQLPGKTFINDNYDDFIGEIFGGEFENSIECLSCGMVSTSTNTFMDLSLPIAPPPLPSSERKRKKKNEKIHHHKTPYTDMLSSKSLQISDVIGAFCEAELLCAENAYACNECTERQHTVASPTNNTYVDEDSDDDDIAALSRVQMMKMVRTDALKRMLISKLPRILTIHLKRFQMRPRGGFEKLQKFVKFKMQLDLAPFVSPSFKGKSTMYRLFGVVSHSGSMGGGHYVSYVNKSESNNNADNDDDDDDWYYFSDTSVKHLKNSSSAMNREAYLLFYHLI